MKTITLINGNGQEYDQTPPKLHILDSYINDVALNHILKNTHLKFEKDAWRGYTAQPHSFDQIVALLLTYNYKTRYYNNGSIKNTLQLKSDRHIGFDVDSICLDCVKENHINSRGLGQNDRLAC